MADSTKDYAPILNLYLLALTLITLIPGLVIHLFIIFINVNDWWKGRSVTSVDYIVTSLGISRLCSQSTHAFYFFLATLFESSLNVFVFRNILSPVYGFFYYNNMWLTSLLSIVLCLKISNFRSRLFRYLRGVILHKTGHCLLASGLLSIINSLMHRFIIDNKVPNDGTYNTTVDNQLMGYEYIYYLYNFTIGSVLPLLFYFTSSILFFTSLYHHTVKMKMNSNLSVNLETYYSAMKFVSFTIMYNTVYFIGQCACALYYYSYFVYLSWAYIILDFLPILHSSYLIYRTDKLRSQMSKILRNVINFLLQRKGAETRESIGEVEVAL
ncbi:taste receptor type 2 member 9-like [Anomaloglossus baeobatrachus]|uniref:taste receptor type 2 member 9-like n=1 Tax=Anomaloglossus baeobatrachus TaxID=238106 RepID=UPI003F4F9F80